MTISLRIAPIDSENFSPFGWLIGAPVTAGSNTGPTNAGPRPLPSAGRPINDGTSLRFDNFGELSLVNSGGEPCLALFHARARDIRGPWQTLERHRLGTQTFIPMAGARYVVLVGLGESAPDLQTLAAFSVAGNQAVTLRAGTWHHGLLALDDGDFVVIERRAADIDCDIAQLLEPVALIADQDP